MTEPHRPRVKYVIGPDGSPLTIADLPAPGTKRWVIRRKAEVVAAVRGGAMIVQLERNADHVVTVGLEERSRHRRIDAARHGDDNPRVCRPTFDIETVSHMPTGRSCGRYLPAAPGRPVNSLLYYRCLAASCNVGSARGNAPLAANTMPAGHFRPPN